MSRRRRRQKKCQTVSYAAANGAVFRCALKVVMVAELFVTAESSRQLVPWIILITECLWIKVHQVPVTCACAEVVVVCNGVFRSYSSPKIFAMSQSCSKSRWYFEVFWATIFWRMEPKFLTYFMNLGHRRTCAKVRWRSAKQPPRLRGEKKRMKGINIRIKNRLLSVRSAS